MQLAITFLISEQSSKITWTAVELFVSTTGINEVVFAIPMKLVELSVTFVVVLSSFEVGAYVDVALVEVFVEVNESEKVFRKIVFNKVIGCDEILGIE